MKKVIYRIAIVVLVILLILCFIWGIMAVYKAVIITKIFSNMESKVTLKNYYVKMTSKEDESSNMEIYYKNGTGKLVTSSGVYTWTNGTDAYMIDEVNKIAYTLTTEDLGLISEEAVASMLPRLF